MTRKRPSLEKTFCMYAVCRRQVCYGCNSGLDRRANFKTLKEPKNRITRNQYRQAMQPGGPVRQPYSYSVPSPHRLFKNSSTGDLKKFEALSLNGDCIFFQKEQRENSMLKPVLVFSKNTECAELKLSLGLIAPKRLFKKKNNDNRYSTLRGYYRIHFFYFLRLRINYLQ